MRKNFYISFGVWLIFIPFFGIPSDWKNILNIISGIFLILFVLGPDILKSLQSRKIKNQSDSIIKPSI